VARNQLHSGMDEGSRALSNESAFAEYGVTGSHGDSVAPTLSYVLSASIWPAVIARVRTSNRTPRERTIPNKTRVMVLPPSVLLICRLCCARA
jgi:hypothetical protein